MNTVDWENRYYTAEDAKKRKEILNERLAEEEMSPELELIAKLYDIRYKPEKKEPEQIDHMLRGLISLKLMETRGGFFSRVPKKELLAVYKDLGKETAESYGELGRRIWYRELNHAGKLLIHINLGDHGYTSMFWGLGQLKDSTVKFKIAKDIYKIAYQTPRTLELTDELEVMTAAVTASFNETFPDDKGVLEQLIRDGEDR